MILTEALPMRSHSKLFASAVIAVSAIASVSASLAADLAPRYKAPPVAAPVMIYNWSGCYIGGNVGGGWKRNTLNTTTTFLGTPVAFTNLGSDNGSSVIGGAMSGPGSTTSARPIAPSKTSGFDRP